VGPGQLPALAFTAAIDDPERFRRSRAIGAYFGLYEAANVMLTRYKGPLKLKDWALAIAKRSTMRKTRIALARRLAIIMHAMLRHGTEFKPA
jgi:transposase